MNHWLCHLPRQSSFAFRCRYRAKGWFLFSFWVKVMNLTFDVSSAFFHSRSTSESETPLSPPPPRALTRVIPSEQSNESPQLNSNESPQANSNESSEAKFRIKSLEHGIARGKSSLNFNSNQFDARTNIYICQVSWRRHAFIPKICLIFGLGRDFHHI